MTPREKKFFQWEIRTRPIRNTKERERKRYVSALEAIIKDKTIKEKPVKR
jgi:hypothetical protein